MPRIIMEEAKHKRFVYLSVLWCRIRAQKLAAKGERRRYLQDRMTKIEAEQDALLAEAKALQDGERVPATLDAVALPTNP